MAVSGEVVSTKGSVTSTSTTNTYVQRRSLVSLANDWVDVCTAPETADNSGNVVTDPAALSRSDLNWLIVGGAGTHVAFRMKYDDGVSSVTVNPIVQIFGEDSNGKLVKLKDANGVHEITLTVDLSNDVSDGTLNWTDHAVVDALGSQRVLITIKAGFAATGTVNTSVIEAKVF